VAKSVNYLFGFRQNVVSKYSFDPSVHSTIHLCSQGDQVPISPTCLWAAQKDSQVSLFILLGSHAKKAAHKMLVKLTAGINFINVLRTNFLYECHFSTYFLALSKICTKNTRVKRWWNWPQVSISSNLFMATVTFSRYQCFFSNVCDVYCLQLLKIVAN